MTGRNSMRPLPHWRGAVIWLVGVFGFLGFIKAALVWPDIADPLRMAALGWLFVFGLLYLKLTPERGRRR